MSDQELINTYNIVPHEIIETEYPWFEELISKVNHELQQNTGDVDDFAFIKQLESMLFDEMMGDILRHCAILKLIDERKQPSPEGVG